MCSLNEIQINLPFAQAKMWEEINKKWRDQDNAKENMIITTTSNFKLNVIAHVLWRKNNIISSFTLHIFRIAMWIKSILLMTISFWILNLNVSKWSVGNFILK